MRRSGKSYKTSPCITISFAPVAESLIDAPDENFRPNNFAASFNFNSINILKRFKQTRQLK